MYAGKLARRVQAERKGNGGSCVRMATFAGKVEALHSYLGIQFDVPAPGAVREMNAVMGIVYNASELAPSLPEQVERLWVAAGIQEQMDAVQEHNMMTSRVACHRSMLRTVAAVWQPAVLRVQLRRAPPGRRSVRVIARMPNHEHLHTMHALLTLHTVSRRDHGIFFRAGCDKEVHQRCTFFVRGCRRATYIR